MTFKKITPLEITMGSLFVAMMAVGANITSIAPFMVVGGVPITLQTFFAILAGLVLGSRLGAFSMLVYMLLGLAGTPIFAQFKGGASVILTPTFGFILSFILVAFIVGKLIESNRGFRMYIIAGLTGMVINYLFGTNWMYAAYRLWFEAPEGLSYALVWSWMVAPLPKDIILSVFAGIFAFRLEKRVLSRSKFRLQGKAS
ncbi:biotin transport system substrate-specific component [Aquibacillus albus]|uniref:Biotin transporter n=2 Tax=Aquibacillus albus TaxID=1168171 RepID=A0ABS2MXF0_9BACI|nr:biotin transport system substrate-specific component [Aquibacillus albus]